MREMGMTKPIDPDFKALRHCADVLTKSCPRMREATLRWLWDVFVTNAKTAPKQLRKCKHS